MSAEGALYVQESLQLLASERAIAGNVKVCPHQFGLRLDRIFGKCITDKAKRVGKLQFEQLIVKRSSKQALDNLNYIALLTPHKN